MSLTTQALENVDTNKDAGKGRGQTEPKFCWVFTIAAFEEKHNTKDEEHDRPKQHRSPILWVDDHVA